MNQEIERIKTLFRNGTSVVFSFMLMILICLQFAVYSLDFHLSVLLHAQGSIARDYFEFQEGNKEITA